MGRFCENLCSSAQSADAKLFPASENISRNESGALGSAAEVILEKLGIEHHIAQAYDRICHGARTQTPSCRCDNCLRNCHCDLMWREIAGNPA